MKSFYPPFITKEFFCKIFSHLNFKLIFLIPFLFGMVNNGFSQIDVDDDDYFPKTIILKVCVIDLGNDLFSATFGYVNLNDSAITLDQEDSYLEYNDGTSIQSTDGLINFKKGTVNNAFTRQFMNTEEIVWTVKSPNGKTKSIRAYNGCTFCPAAVGGVIFPLYDQGNGKTDVVLGLELKALAEGNAGSTPSNVIYQIRNNKVLVEVIPKVGQLLGVLNTLQTTFGLGYDPNPLNSDFIIHPDTISSKGLSTVDVYFPIANLLDLNGFVNEINFVRVQSPTVKNAGIVTSQGDGAQKSDLVRDAFRMVRNDEIVPVNGAGIKIGVLSDSYNTQPFTGTKSKAQIDVENGDLPGLLNPDGFLQPVQVLKEYPYGEGSDEGRAMLQIVHDVAPGAALAFYTGVVSPRDFELGLLALQAAGCTVIVDDITFPAEPFFGQGRIAQAIQNFTAIPGNSYITSAGNFSNDGYQNIFSPSTDLLETNFLPVITTQKTHVFGANLDGSEDVLQSIRVQPGIYMLVLQWDEDLASQENSSGAADDLDFYLVDDFGRLIVGNNRVNDAGDPTEVMFFQATGIGEANILITNASLDPTVDLPFRFIAFRSTGLEFLEYDGAPTVSGHAMTPEAITVGAVDYRDAQNPESQFFTSKAGDLADLTSIEVDISAPDGVNTNVNSIGQDIDGDGFLNFFGTSASAPHVAGAMALLKSAKTSWYPLGLPIEDLTLFQTYAVMFGSVELAGAGLLDANNAFKHIASQTSQLLQLTPEAGKIPSADYFEVTINGKFFPESETVTVNEEELPSIKVTFDGVELDTIILVSPTEIKARIAPFVGNPPLIVNSTPITPGGTDGGNSNPIYFFDDGKIAFNIIANNVSVEFGQDVAMSFSAEGLPDGTTFESLGLPNVIFTTSAEFPFPDVNNYIITSSFETPLTPEQQELFQVNFINGILTVTKKELLIQPIDAVVTYGEAIQVPLSYTYDEINITDTSGFLMAVEMAHQTDFYPENTLIFINKFRAVVNEQEILDLMNNGSWMASDRFIQNKFRAVVNGMNVVDLDVEHFNDYINTDIDPISNKFRAVVNKFRAVVNGEDLLNNRVDLVIENKFRAVVNGTGLANATDTNDYSSIFAIVDQEDASTETEERTIDNVYALNLLTGLDADTPGGEQQYVFPGAFLAPIAANFNTTYGSGRLSILKAGLEASTGDIEIDKGESPDISQLVTTFNGFVYDETVEIVFPDGIPYYFEDDQGHVYEPGDSGDFNIKIQDPLNYMITYITQGKLKVKALEYCDSKQKKVYICHNGKTICVSINAMDAHLNHGDSLGSCSEEGNAPSDDENDSSFILFPNPVENQLTIQRNISGQSDIFIFDIYGNQYYYKKLKKKDNNLTVNMNSYPSGVYYVRIISDNKTRTYNLVKN